MTARRSWVISAIQLGVVHACVIGCARQPAPVPAPAPVIGTTPSVATPAASAVPARTQGALQQFVDSLVELPQFASAHWGVLVVAPDRRDTLASVQSDRLVMPASNMKLVTAAVGLTQLGPDFTWPTEISRTGTVVRGVLRGDLIVAGTGDPSISTAMRDDPLSAFDPLVAALRTAGITRIDGRIRAADSTVFPGSPYGYGWDYDDLDTEYGAGVTDLMFNEAFTDVEVRGCGRVGSVACVTTAPLRTSPTVRSTVRTRAAGTGGPDITWWRDSGSAPGLTIRGSIATGDTYRFSASQPDGRGTYLAAITEALTRAGIRVTATSSHRAGTATARTPLVALTSRPLREVLAAMQKPSQNQIAEVLFRTIGRMNTGVGTPDSARAVVERQLTAWNVRSDAHAIRDGSGLSRHDYLTPRLLVQVLDTMRRSPFFDVFYESLPVAGEDGTLQHRMQAFAQRRVRAKTGTIDKARALSGYVTTADGELLIFSIIANNQTVPTREVDRVAELIVERLVRTRRPAP